MRHLVTPTAILLTVALAGCPTGQAPEPGRGEAVIEPGPEAIEGAPAPVPTATPGAATDWSGIHGHMQDHIIHLDKARQALIVGDLDASKRAFGWLGEHTPVAGLPEGWLPHVEAMQGAAVRGTNAMTYADGGSALGSVAEACGACHAANNASIEFPRVPAPVAQPGSPGHMQRHAWASDRLWESLIKPDDDLWEQGMRMLNEDSLDHLSSGKPLPESVRRFGDRVHKIGLEGIRETDPTMRISLFGDFIAQCASCHTKTGQGPQ